MVGQGGVRRGRASWRTIRGSIIHGRGRECTAHVLIVAKHVADERRLPLGLAGELVHDRLTLVVPIVLGKDVVVLLDVAVDDRPKVVDLLRLSARAGGWAVLFHFDVGLVSHLPDLHRVPVMLRELLLHLALFDVALSELGREGLILELNSLGTHAACSRKPRQMVDLWRHFYLERLKLLRREADVAILLDLPGLVSKRRRERRALQIPANGRLLGGVGAVLDPLLLVHYQLVATSHLVGHPLRAREERRR